MKERGQQPPGFRKLAVGAAVSIWLGLILLAVGLVFTLSTRSQQTAMAVGQATAAPAEPFAAQPTLSGSAPDATAPTAESPLESTDASDPAVAPEPADTSGSAAALEPTPVEVVTPLPTETAAVPVEPPTLTPVPEDTATPEPTPTPVRGKPVRLVATSIGLDTGVVEVGWHVETIEGTNLAVWDVADFAAGWHKTSARPGDGGNIVISGHHNINGEVFRYLVDLQVGADLVLYADDRPEPYVYRVDEVLILPEKGQPLEVRRANAAYIEPTTEERLTLVTCWPYNNNTHRIVVTASPEY